jgi:hypothetical protein
LKASKDLLGEFLLWPEGVPSKSLNLDELVPILDKCKYISSPSI